MPAAGRIFVVRCGARCKVVLSEFKQPGLLCCCVIPLPRLRIKAIPIQKVLSSRHYSAYSNYQPQDICVLCDRTRSAACFGFCYAQCFRFPSMKCRVLRVTEIMILLSQANTVVHPSPHTRVDWNELTGSLMNFHFLCVWSESDR